MRRDNQTCLSLIIWTDLLLAVLFSFCLNSSACGSNNGLNFGEAFWLFDLREDTFGISDRHPFLSFPPFWTPSLFTHAGRNLRWHLIDWLLWTHWPGSSRRSKYSGTKAVNAQSALLIRFACFVVGLEPSQSHGPLRRVREAYPGPVSPQRAGPSLARQVRAVLRV